MNNANNKNTVYYVGMGSNGVVIDSNYGKYKGHMKRLHLCQTKVKSTLGAASTSALLHLQAILPEGVVAPTSMSVGRIVYEKVITHDQVVPTREHPVMPVTFYPKK